MKSVWSKSGNTFKLDEISHQSSELPAGVYRLEYNAMFNFFFLEHVQDQFSFPYKVYGVETDFIQRVKKTWDNTTNNMGVLLNGLKGTGKTVTAELICNEMKLPVILVQKSYENIVSFLNSIQQDVIIFIDEYEKIYSKYDNTLLSIMDGAFRTDSRKMFLLTTNDLSIDRNMLQRPSRIRYIKSYTDLSLDIIMQVVNDKLEHKHLRECTIKMISELPIITMDLVKSVIEEVNIHEENPEFFKDYFNVQGDMNDIYNVYVINEDGTKTEFQKSATVIPSGFTSYDEGESFYINRRRIGIIGKVINKSQVVIIPDDDDDEDVDSVDPNKETQQPCVFQLEPAKKTHRAFHDAAF